MSIPKVFFLNYTLRAGDSQGEVIEAIEDNQSETFLFGVGNLIPDFEAKINPLQKGDAFEFIVEAEQAYGSIDEHSIIELPKTAFMVEGELAQDELFVGNIIPMADQNGNPLHGKVLEIMDEVVVMDFNHPLAGQDLHFKGVVVDVRAATAQEIEHGHVHDGDSC